MAGAGVTWPSPARIRYGAHLLRGGGIIAYPTEGVYGLGCNPRDKGAVARLLDLKQRPAAKGLILLAAEPAQLAPFLAPLPSPEWARLTADHGSPVTWIVPAATGVPSWLRGAHTSIAVRITRHAPAAALCRAFGGPIVSTSANPAGRPPARNALRVRRYFAHQADGLVVGPLGGAAGPSEIRDLRTGAIIRPGG